MGLTRVGVLPRGFQREQWNLKLWKKLRIGRWCGEGLEIGRINALEVLTSPSLPLLELGLQRERIRKWDMAKVGCLKSRFPKRWMGGGGVGG